MKKKFTQILLASVIVSSTLVPFVQAEAAGTNQTTVSQAGMTLSQQQFIQSIANDAQDLQKEEKILTSVTLAQAILESNWVKVAYQLQLITCLELKEAMKVVPFNGNARI